MTLPIRAKRDKTLRLRRARERLRAEYERRRMRDRATVVWVDVPPLTEEEAAWINSLD